MLEIENSCLAIVDVQGKLAQLMYDKEQLFRNLEILARSANILEMKILFCRQNPKALGPVIDELAPHLNAIEPGDKFVFSCCGSDEFNSQLEAANVKNVILCGIESHICVTQTAIDLIDKGYAVHVIADAVSSRTKRNKKIGIKRMQQEGAKVSSTEMVLFELLKTAEHPNFRDIARLIK